ncbi:MAG: hypothetical protein LBH02_01075, partial [Methanocalculaceae archaeon]|nr:hypothetical protein [Methanocalculaceae archaeon]
KLVRKSRYFSVSLVLYIITVLAFAKYLTIKIYSVNSPINRKTSIVCDCHLISCNHTLPSICT